MPAGVGARKNRLFSQSSPGRRHPLCNPLNTNDFDVDRRQSVVYLKKNPDMVMG